MNLNFSEGNLSFSSLKSLGLGWGFSKIRTYTGGPRLVRFHLVRSPVQYNLKIVLNTTNSPIQYGFLSFFSQKTVFLKVHFMYLVLVPTQYDFSIVRFPGSPKFVLVGDPLYMLSLLSVSYRMFFFSEHIRSLNKIDLEIITGSRILCHYT